MFPLHRAPRKIFYRNLLQICKNVENQNFSQHWRDVIRTTLSWSNYYSDLSRDDQPEDHKKDESIGQLFLSNIPEYADYCKVWGFVSGLHSTDRSFTLQYKDGNTYALVTIFDDVTAQRILRHSKENKLLFDENTIVYAKISNRKKGGNFAFEGCHLQAGLAEPGQFSVHFNWFHSIQLLFDLGTQIIDVNLNDMWMYTRIVACMKDLLCVVCPTNSNQNQKIQTYFTYRCPPKCYTKADNNQQLRTFAYGRDDLHDSLTHCYTFLDGHAFIQFARDELSKHVNVIFSDSVISIQTDIYPEKEIQSDFWKTMPDECIWKIETLLTAGVFQRHEIDRIVAQWTNIPVQSIPMFCDFLLFKAKRIGKARNFPSPLLEAFKDKNENFLQQCIQYFKDYNPPKTVKQDNYVSIRRLFVTPGKWYCAGPEEEISNRVIRHFAKECPETHFLRVSFVDENLQTISPSEGSVHLLAKRIDLLFKSGINVGGKLYMPLAYSASQLRSNSMWFFANTATVTADSIRNWIGYISEESVAKYAARLGLAFTATHPAAQVSFQDQEVQEIPDIKNSQYVFSDGVGTISTQLAAEVAKNLGLDFVPSAFQIRYAGYKGVLCVDNQLSPPVKMCLRPSMRKFQSSHNVLEVIRPAVFSSCYLNRQVIVLLSSLGVPDQVFLDMQGQMLADLSDMLSKPEKISENLLKYAPGTIHQQVAHLIQAGIDVLNEPYLSGLLSAVYQQKFADLKNKARILVQGGGFFIGVMDEYAVLEYGQVFVQHQATPEDRPCILKGTVVVTKNPCLDTGSILQLEAVNVPQLRHLKNVIVFPSKGKRPHSNEASGSDLDGDVYWVSYDPRLFPLKKGKPMEFPAQKAVSYDHSFKQVLKFFLDFIQHNNLGMISNAWLCHADQSPAMAEDPKCIELAQLHSIAVDFCKSGVPAKFPRHLIPRVYPHFMQKTDKPSYISEKVLGKLFDQVVTYQREMKKYPDVTPVDKDLMVPGYENHLESAIQHRNQYNTELIKIMNHYHIKTECEALSGAIFKVSKFVRKDIWDVKQQVMSAIKHLTSSYKKVYEDLVQKFNGTQALEIASAWYCVTYLPQYKAEDIPLLSFPWILADQLADIKKKRAT